MATPNADLVAAATNMAVDQVNSLWTIAAALIAAQILIIAHVLHKKQLPFAKSEVAWAVFFSIASEAISIFCGYCAKGALTLGMMHYAQNETWSEDSSTSTVAELFTSGQILFLTLALVAFIFAFWFYSQILAEAIVSTSGAGGNGDEDDKAPENKQGSGS